MPTVQTQTDKLPLRMTHGRSQAQYSGSELESAAMARPRPSPAILLAVIFVLAVAAAVLWRQKAGQGGAASDAETTGGGMVGVDGTRFVVGGGRRPMPIYFSGFNAYWLMLLASDPARRGKVVAAFRQAADHGLNLARTWAFSDGGDTPLQTAPGVYDEAMFQALDLVVAEARRHGIYLLLCLTNNFHDFGGKRQYVQWARDAGHRLATDDDFFNNTVVKAYYKNHVKTVLTRVNTLTGVAYKDDPTIFAWELMNEPRCDADPTGAMVQAWVEEMAPYVKSIDGEHLVTAGLEGFYGLGLHESKDLNPWGIYYGTNFIETHRAVGVDFATIHLYPDVWLWGSAADTQLAFLRNWTCAHDHDAHVYLRKPLLVTEYGKFLWEERGFTGAGDNNRTRQRDYFLRLVLDSIYASAARGGPLVGGAFWQLLDGGMDTLRDGYEIILPEDQLAAAIIGNHSRQLAQLSRLIAGEKEAAIRRRRGRWRSAHSRKIHVRSGGRSDSYYYYTQTQQLLHKFLVRFISLFTSVSSLFTSA